MSESPALALRCLVGRPCPDDVVVHARSATKLTPTAIEHLPEVLDPCVVEPMNQKLASALTQFSLRYEIAEADLGRTLRACRFLVRESSAVDAPIETFAEDFAQLFPDAPALGGVLRARYEALKKAVRTQLYLAALEEHGAVLADVGWRVDLVATTSQAARLLMPVAMLTLSYRQNGAEQRLTLQVPGDVMRKLRDVADLVLK